MTLHQFFKILFVNYFLVRNVVCTWLYTSSIYYGIAGNCIEWRIDLNMDKLFYKQACTFHNSFFVTRLMCWTSTRMQILSTVSAEFLSTTAKSFTHLAVSKIRRLNLWCSAWCYAPLKRVIHSESGHCK